MKLKHTSTTLKKKTSGMDATSNLMVPLSVLLVLELVQQGLILPWPLLEIQRHFLDLFGLQQYPLVLLQQKLTTAKYLQGTMQINLKRESYETKIRT